MNKRHKKIIEALYKCLSDFSYTYDRYSDRLTFELRSQKGSFKHTLTEECDVDIYVELINLY